MTRIQNRSHDLANHQHIVEVLSRETDTPVERVEEIYLVEQEKLERVARVKNFVPIFTNRRVKEVLQSEREAAAPGETPLAE